MAKKISRIDLITRAYEMRDEMRAMGFNEYSGFFSNMFPEKYKHPIHGDRNKSRLLQFMNGRVYDLEMLKEAEQVLKFLKQTSSKYQAA